VLYEWGYRTDYPLLTYERTIHEIEEIGIKRPITYEIYRHANCVGCLKAGKQHWYIVYCLRPDIFDKAKRAEKEIGFSIIRDAYLEDLECQFENMRKSGITPTESVNFQKFWADVRKAFPDGFDNLPCDCHESPDGLL